ncbi:condensation domain-containing protein [Streptomyces sp. AD16]|nr:condensation domain-containing protein [Streptomyces sp. AD16]
MPAGLTERLTRAGRARRASLFMVLTAVTQLVLARWTDRRDLALGTVVSGRERPETEGLVGFFVNTLVLRSRIDESLSFAEFLDEVRRTVLDAFARQDVPFSTLVEELAPERDTSRTPLVQAMLVLQNTPPAALELPGSAPRSSCRPARRPSSTCTWSSSRTGTAACRPSPCTVTSSRAPPSPGWSGTG